MPKGKGKGGGYDSSSDDEDEWDPPEILTLKLWDQWNAGWGCPPRHPCAREYLRLIEMRREGENTLKRGSDQLWVPAYADLPPPKPKSIGPGWGTYTIEEEAQN